VWLFNVHIIISTLFYQYFFSSRNLENTERPVYSVKAHSEIINAIDGVGGLGIGEGAPEIVTGSRDGKYEMFSFLIAF